ncbi:MAG: CoA transferase, partial [Chloroflexota bacterium]
MMTADPQFPLADLRVIDLADEKGVFGAKLIADLGADVIKVEKPGGDATRNIGPFQDDDPHPEKSLYFAYNNTNKRAITLDITHPDGADILRRLARDADVIIETFRPGYLGGLGLDYASLSRENPRLIMTSVTGFGQYGPYARFNAPDIVSFAMGGLMFQTGDPDMPPLLAGGMQTYYVSSLFAAAATMVAIQA